MALRVKEKTISEIQGRINEMNTELNKIAYLESALKSDFTFEIKRFILQNLAELYESRMMFEKAARAMFVKAGVEISSNDKVESYLKAGELYAKAGKIDDSESMFIKAARDFEMQRSRIFLTMKNIFLVSAGNLEKKGKKASALKFYEKLIRAPLDESEKEEIKKKLAEEYKSLGKFREAKLLEGI